MHHSKTRFLGQPFRPMQDCGHNIKVTTNILKQYLNGSEINQLKILFCQTEKRKHSDIVCYEFQMTESPKEP